MGRIQRFLACVGVLTVLSMMGLFGDKRPGDGAPGSSSASKYQGSDNVLDQWFEKSYGQGSAAILREIKETGKLYVPAVGTKESLLSLVDRKRAQRIKEKDIDPGNIHMAVVTMPDGNQLKAVAVYTAARNLNNLEFIREVNAREFMELALKIPEAEGLTVNPNTRFLNSSHDGMMLTTNRFGLAEIIGFLDSHEDVSERPYHELANESFNRGSYYETLYWWARSYRQPRARDDWKLAEGAKLKAYYNLDFPESRDRARSELAWMKRTHPEASDNLPSF